MRISSAGPLVVILFAAVAVCGCGSAPLLGGTAEPGTDVPADIAADGGMEPELAACPSAGDFEVEPEPESRRLAAVEDQIWRALRLGFLDENADVRDAAESSLCHTELKPAVAFPEWKERIERSGRQEVCSLVYALHRMGWRGEDPVPELIRLLDSDDEETATFAAEALGV
ncbi:MAG: hypothetical protein JRF63_01510, partial [Deltaproteobacteria bacterium]|nr:hypothetical protein [Deltaproteobacteria bacterium]